MRPKFQRFTTFNCQGHNDKVKQKNIAEKFYKSYLEAIVVAETLIEGTGSHELTSSDGKKIVNIIQEMEKN